MSPNLKRGFYQSSENIIMDNLSNSYPTGGIFDDVGGAWRSPITDTHAPQKKIPLYK